MKKVYCILIFSAIFLFVFCEVSLAHQPRLVYLQEPSPVIVENPEVSQAFYDELKGFPKSYFIESEKDFELYINLLVPEHSNGPGKYSALVFVLEDGDINFERKIAELDGELFDWKGFYEPYGRDYYLKGPEFFKQIPPGKYKIEVYSRDNQGKYVLAVGKKEVYNFSDILGAYWKIPLLKITFFKTSVMQFFLTPFGIAGIGLIGVILIIIALVNYLVWLAKENKRKSQAKTLLLTSGGMAQMKDEIMKLLQKPAYDVTVAFITTAAKPEENINYVKRDWDIMKDELGFNVEEVDIEGKTEAQVEKELQFKDIIFVEGGNTFYLLKAMRACNFEKTIRKILETGTVYIGASAGSIITGKTIQPADRFGTGKKDHFGVKDLRGLNLVPFDIVPHFDSRPEMAEIIKQKIPDPKKRAEDLRILTDDQGILVQGNEVSLIGEGEAVVV